MENSGRENWNKFVIENNGLFLQSWKWGELQKSLGRKIWRLGDGENWQALVIKYELPLGKNYLYCPGGPTMVSSIKYNVSGIIREFLKQAKQITEKEKAIFLKVEPFEKTNIEENISLAGETFSKNWRKLNFRESDGGQRILKTLVLDLEKPEEQLLAEMKQKTRYNIKVAERHGVKIRISENPEKDFEYFWQLAEQTRERDKFGIHAREYYKKQVSAGSAGAEFKLFLAEHEGKIIAANIAVFFGNRAVYLHGASSNEARNAMAPYLLQWEQIAEAKKRGCAIYDFWGIDENKWPGVTRFKKGFGGDEVDYMGTYDYVFNRLWYRIYKITRRIL